jgi:hypothetical protein
LSQQEDNFWKDKTQTLSLTIDRPRTSYNVFERWINTEIVYSESSLDKKFRDPYFRNLQIGVLDSLKKRFPKSDSSKKIQSHPPHPAVRAIGIKVFKDNKELASNEVPIANYEEYLDEKLTLVASCGDNHTEATITFDKTSKKIKIGLGPNKIYQIFI